MKRDHMMGFVQTADEPGDRTVYLTRRYPLGTPNRVWDVLGQVAKDEVARDEVLIDFEERDHTPAHMRAAFPREYDVRAMTADKVGDAYRAILALIDKVPLMLTGGPAAQTRQEVLAKAAAAHEKMMTAGIAAGQMAAMANAKPRPWDAAVRYCHTDFPGRNFASVQEIEEYRAAEKARAISLAKQGWK